MKRTLIALVTGMIFIIALTGCWDQVELPERGFAMGLAIDMTDEGTIDVTTQIYKPALGSINEPNRGAGESVINIRTKGQSLYEAVADIPIHLSRRAQFSHMRVIIIGEQFAKERTINEILDFFSRNNEPRLTNNVIIAQGKASEYLQIAPKIENTSSQEIRRAQQMASERSSKSIEMTLYKLFLQLRGETGNAVLPYISYDAEDKMLDVSGAAVFSQGKMMMILSPSEVEHLLMLLNQFVVGIIEVNACRIEGKTISETMEDVEVLKANTKLKTTLTDNRVKLNVISRLNVSAGELHCSDLSDEKSLKNFIQTTERTIQHGMEDLIKTLKEHKIDVLGIGEQIYRKDPKRWKEQFKKNWEEHFANLEVDYDIKVTINDTGMFIGKSVRQ